ncbi:MAG TPA: type II toxin-antitoxin system RelE/ParE family toxin [Rhodoferax sp.]
MHRVDWSASALEDIEALFDYLAENTSLWDAVNLCKKLVRSTERLAEFPRLYEAAPQYGEGVRRISLSGQHVLYEVDDQAQAVMVLAVVSQRQNPRLVR